jgi:anti-sigma B factor antagonist
MTNGNRLFEATIENGDGMTIVRAAGEIDVASAPELDQMLGQAGDAGVPLVIVDLSEVSLLDSTGLGVLISHLDRLKAKDGTEMRLVATTPNILKVFSITGLDQVFSIFPTAEQAAR